MEPFSSLRSLLFVLGSLFFVWISRKQLPNPRCHGFYRFFAFEGILILILLNQPYWFLERQALHQFISWLLLTTSLLLVLWGLFMLRTKGGSRDRKGTPENFAFENTVHLVTGGIFRYIRHPMYSSLLLLAWGAFFKHVSPVGFAVVLVTTVFLVVAGLIEERENLVFFGPAYEEYRKSTKMFIPFLF